MNINNFIDYNSYCPCCEKKLKLFMASELNDSPNLWRGQILEDSISFTHKKDKNKKLEIIEKDGESMISSFNQHSRELWTHSFYLFFICNEKAIKVTENDFSIGYSDACYYRSSIILQCNNMTTRNIEALEDEHASSPNSEECFYVNHLVNNVEKNYFFIVDYLENKSKLWHYVTEDNVKSINNRILEIDLPMTSTLPSFKLEDRKKLIDKFDCWILMS